MGVSLSLLVCNLTDLKNYRDYKLIIEINL